MLKTTLQCAALALVGTSLWAQAPSGWRTLRSVSKPPATMAGPVVRDGKCTIAVPGAWLDDNTVDRSQSRSPDGRALAFVQEWPSKPHYPTFLDRKKNTLSDYRQQAATAQRVYQKPVIDVKVLKNSSTLLDVMRVGAPTLGTAGTTDWTLLSAGNPICYVMVTVNTAGPGSSAQDRAAAQTWLGVAQQIVASFTPAK